MFSKESLKSWCLKNEAHLTLYHYLNGDNEKPPEEIGFSSGKKVNWGCAICGMKWTAAPNKVTRYVNKKCPYCTHRKPSPFYNLGTEYPELAEQWDKSANSTKAEQHLPSSRINAYWRCEKNHTWEAIISNQVKLAKLARKNGKPICPCCSTYDWTLEYPELVLEWDYTNNNGHIPEKYSRSNRYKAHWKCSFNRAHLWQARISNRTHLYRGCPICSKEFTISYPVRTLFYYLRRNGLDCECEVPLQKKYKIDIVLKFNERKIAIEHDGFYYHDNLEAQNRAIRKNKALQDAGYEILRIRDSKSVSVATLDRNKIVYPFTERNKHLDDMVSCVFQFLKLQPPDIEHRRDFKEIGQLYFRERKLRTLAAKYPKLADEWSKNNDFDPDTVLSKSSRKALWECSKCKKEYQATIVNRVNNGSGCPYCGPKKTKVCDENSLERVYPEIAAEWHIELNGPLTPKDVLPGTDLKVYWRCLEKGHVWKAPVSSRTGPRKHGCPMCSHRTVSDEISLQTVCPQLLPFWHYEKNMPLTPDKVTAKSNKQLWWKCEKGHEWRQSANNMNSVAPGNYCPFCNNRQLWEGNSLAFLHPALAQEWDIEQNFPVTPEGIMFNSKRKVWWRRGELIWQDSVYGRAVNGNNMPPKSKRNVHQIYSLEYLNPELSLQWLYQKNGNLTPTDVSACSNKSVWWKCHICQNEWQARIVKRHSRKDGCPYCSGHRASKENCLENKFPELAAQWHPHKNGTLKPRDVTPGSGKRIWWKCAACANEWQASISNRSIRGQGCPKCVNRSRVLGNLAEESPQLLLEWDFEKNLVRPEDCRARSNKKRWWKCAKCEHTWEASPDARYTGSGCPICSKVRIL